MKRSLQGNDENGDSQPEKKKFKKETEEKDKPDDWIYSQPLWMCNSCGLHNYCDKVKCYGCEADKPEKEPIIAAPVTSTATGLGVMPHKAVIPMLQKGQLLDVLAEAMNNKPAAKREITNPPTATILPPPPAVKPDKPRRSRFDRAPKMRMPPINVAQTWSCFHCKMENVAEKKECWFCRASRGHINLQVSSQGNNIYRPGDWICTYCKVTNYADRTQCFKCKVPKAKQEISGALVLHSSAKPRQQLRFEVFVGNLSVAISEKDIETAFTPWGPLISCRKPSDTYAFIQFPSLENAVRSMNQMDQSSINGQRIRCQWPKNSAISRADADKMAIQLGIKTKGTPELYAMKQSGMQLTTVSHSKRPIRFEVFVGNLSDLISEQDVRVHFERWGTIIGCRKPKNFAFVQYESLEGALNAVYYGHQTDICGQQIKVQWPKDFDQQILVDIVNRPGIGENAIMMINNVLNKGGTKPTRSASHNTYSSSTYPSSSSRSAGRSNTRSNTDLSWHRDSDSHYTRKKYASSKKVDYF